MNEQHQATEVAVVGGGLSGLAAAALLARAGRRVTLFERAATLGGRAATHVKGEFRFNLGPHALYRRGPAAAVLADLGVSYSGGVPSASGAYALERGVKHALPGGFVSLVTTGLLRLPAKLETARLLGGIARIDTAPLQGVSVSDWLQRKVRHAEVRQLVAALVRVATYANAPDLMSAGTALAQVQGALGAGVTYLDGGWQTLIDGLRAAAVGAGTQVVTGSRVTGIEHDGQVRAVRLADGTACPAHAVIIAGSPASAAELITGAAGEPLRRWAAEAIPVKAACLDIGLSRLPRPQARFALGIDQPFYCSLHSAVAKLAPAGGAMIHVAKYLDPASATDAKSDERELDGVLDLVQPGWRDVVTERRFLPSMVVANALTTARSGGTTGRPGPAVPGIANLYISGDWVGTEGLLADASLASAREAAALILQQARSSSAAAAAA